MCSGVTRNVTAPRRIKGKVKEAVADNDSSSVQIGSLGACIMEGEV